MMKAIALFILWFIVWLFLSWPPSVKDIICAAIVSLFVSFMTLDLLMRPAGRGAASRIDPVGFIVRCLWFLLYALIFIWECFRANLDVAYRVLHPDLPIKPGTVRVKVGLKSDIALTFLANSITLTPGTTSIDIDKENGHIYVHCLYIKEDNARLPLVEKFEKLLKRIFE